MPKTVERPWQDEPASGFPKRLAGRPDVLSRGAGAGHRKCFTLRLTANTGQLLGETRSPNGKGLHFMNRYRFPRTSFRIVLNRFPFPYGGTGAGWGQRPPP